MILLKYYRINIKHRCQPVRQTQYSNWFRENIFSIYRVAEKFYYKFSTYFNSIKLLCERIRLHHSADHNIYKIITNNMTEENRYCLFDTLEVLRNTSNNMYVRQLVILHLLPKKRVTSPNCLDRS